MPSDPESTDVPGYRFLGRRAFIVPGRYATILVSVLIYRQMDTGEIQLVCDPTVAEIVLAAVDAGHFDDVEADPS